MKKFRFLFLQVLLFSPFVTFSQTRDDAKIEKVYNERQQSSKPSNVDSLKSILESVWKSDQENRLKLLALMKDGKSGTEEFKNLIFAIKKADTINLPIVTTIIDQYGWLGTDEIGFNASQALFLVIQHADLVTQEKYLPLIRQAANEGKTLMSNLAILEDRVALRQGKKQPYGSQVWVDQKTGNKYVQPIEDVENVDQKRTAVGLPIMDEYLMQSFQIHWNIDEYKRNLPVLEELMKKQKK